jgi:hypothetical protein
MASGIAIAAHPQVTLFLVPCEVFNGTKAGAVFPNDFRGLLRAGLVGAGLDEFPDP